MTKAQSPITQALDDMALQQAIGSIVSENARSITNNGHLIGVTAFKRTLRRHGFTIVPLVEVTTKVDP